MTLLVDAPDAHRVLGIAALLLQCSGVQIVTCAEPCDWSSLPAGRIGFRGYTEVRETLHLMAFPNGLPVSSQDVPVGALVCSSV